MRKAPSLPDLQDWMRRVLTHPKGVHHALFHSGKPGIKKHLHIIGETREVDRQTRLSIYGNGYFSRLIDCLAINYEVLHKEMGEDAFAQFARDYLTKYPSKYKCIDDIGEEIPELIKKHPLVKKKAYLPDLARLEWAAHLSFYADDKPLFNRKKLALLSNGNGAKAKLILDPSVRLIDVNWPVDSLWRTGEKRGMKKKKLSLLIYRRPDKQVRVTRIDNDQSKLLSSLKNKRTLAQSLGHLSIKKIAAVQSWFTDWASRGVFHDIV